MDFDIRDAVPEDVNALTRIALKSKAHWGYDSDFMKACIPVLTITPDMISKGRMRVAQDGASDDILGFSFLKPDTPVSSLDLLYIDPATIGRGAGRALLEDALHYAKAFGGRVQVESDPHAEAFYLHCGAKRIGTAPSEVIPDRILPLLEFS